MNDFRVFLNQSSFKLLQSPVFKLTDTFLGYSEFVTQLLKRSTVLAQAPTVYDLQLSFVQH